MTTYSEARVAIATAVDTGWSSVFPSVPVFYDNGLAPDLNSIEEFLGCHISFHASKARSLAGLDMRVFGTITFIVARKAASGYSKSLEKADVLIDLFRFKQGGGVTFTIPHLLPPVEDKGWFYLEIVAPFFFDN